MRLVQIAGGAPAVPLPYLRVDAELMAEVQSQLTVAGLLDPPPDGEFGAVTRWALGEFLSHWGLAGAISIDLQVASALLQADAAFPVVTGPDFAGDVVRAMQKGGHWFCRHPKALNIVCVTGMGLDGWPSTNPAIQYRDARLLVRVGEHGVPGIAGAWEALGLTGRTPSGDREFMSMLEGDPRRVAGPNYRFPVTMLAAQAVIAARA
jgi:hypothetical protein